MDRVLGLTCRGSRRRAWYYLLMGAKSSPLQNGVKIRFLVIRDKYLSIEQDMHNQLA